MARRIALVEDDPTIRQNYVDALTRAGYEVAAFGDRASASRTLAARLPELAIIDIGLGADIDGGFALCRDLRNASARLPIIFLSARDSDFDIVSGLRLGADDYLTKDVSLPHLLARISALFRRVDAAAQAPIAEDVMQRGRLALDAQRMAATWSGKTVGLTVTEFWMVHSLARHPGHVKDREQLMRDAEMVVDDGTITSHVKRIRKKFLAVDADFDAIETVYGMGYRWTEPA
jgi:two-component system OmpR family response regulator